MTRYDKILSRIKNHPVLSIILIIGVLTAPLAYIMGIFQNVSSLFLKSREPSTIHQEMEKSPGSIQAGRDVNIIIGSNRPPESQGYKTEPEKQSSKVKPHMHSEQNKHGEVLPKEEVVREPSTVNAKVNGEKIKMKTKPKLWITYAWKDNAGGNFDFLIQELEKAGIDTTFDKVALVPGRRLWEQIAARIEDPTLDGWAILLTRQSLQSEPCREELAYALDRALNTKSAGFPLIGLMDQIGSDEVPGALKVRVMIDLRDPRWPQLVLAGLKKVAPEKALPQVTRYNWEFKDNFRGPHTLAIMIRPRFGELRFWRFIFPENAKVLEWGIGPPRNPVMTSVINGRLRDNRFGEVVTYVGAGDAITPGYGCYIIFEEPFPKTVGFGAASEPFEPPTNDTIDLLEILKR